MHVDQLCFKVVQRTQSGQLILNETFAQVAVYEIPFGGQGQSGCMLRSVCR